MINQLIPWILGLIAAYFGVKWQTSAKENEGLKQKLGSKKEELYTNFIEFYMKILNSKVDQEDIVKKTQDLNQKMLLTASNKVFLTYGDLMQNFYLNPKDTKQSLKLLGELILAMREDLGHKDWLNNLFWFDSIRPWIKDINTYLPKKYKNFRRMYNIH